MNQSADLSLNSGTICKLRGKKFNQIQRMPAYKAA